MPATAPPSRWMLNPQRQDPNTFPWLQEFHTWVAKQHVHAEWVDPKRCSQHHLWSMKLKLNGHVLEPVGSGDTKQKAQINLIQQLENADPAVFTNPLRQDLQQQA
ncbi:hypothetical protein FRC09_003235 [Ceratobasidium sp. 395]|nr:hypothetical protein FRC09_003235 [Ceratobasidium sp. 395]